MNQNREERRRFPRLFFSAEERITGVFRLSDPYHIYAVAGITDLNPEGMGISFHKDECPQLVNGDSLTLLKIHDPRLAFMKDIDMKIQWVINHRDLEHMAMGCKFTGISSGFSGKITEIVSSWLSQKAEPSGG